MGNTIGWNADLSFLCSLGLHGKEATSFSREIPSSAGIGVPDHVAGLFKMIRDPCFWKNDIIDD
jgi:hypothetical protein